MSDVDFKLRCSLITEPREALAVLVDEQNFLGYDPYYSDLRAAMLEMAERCARDPGEKARREEMGQHDWPRGGVQDFVLALVGICGPRGAPCEAVVAMTVNVMAVNPAQVQRAVRAALDRGDLELGDRLNLVVPGLAKKDGL